MSKCQLDNRYSVLHFRCALIDIWVRDNAAELKCNWNDNPLCDRNRDIKK